MYKGKNLPRDTLASSRGIRVTSVPGKLIAVAISDPIFPHDQVYEESICQEQFAGRKKHSADLLALILQMIVHCAGNNPLYIILLDIQKAFDTMWRDALWHKLVRQGHSPRHVSWLKALYNKLLTAVRSDDGLSDFEELVHGIGR